MGKFTVDFDNKLIIIEGSYLPHELVDFNDEHMDVIDLNEFHVEHRPNINSGDIIFPEEQKDKTF